MRPVRRREQGRGMVGGKSCGGNVARKHGIPSVTEDLSVQDIAGQRVNKVVKSITYVEKRVNALVDMWGKDRLAEVEVPVDREKTTDEQLVSGPQLEGDGLSQDDIDNLFD